ncbi:Protein CBR-DAF-25 [Caenorhabditis briggsae]|uniref:Protein CBR-DAF-25 n=1 Tax=Caenorhabditis briggsae TaxID=6238 RepID=A8Y1G4_CAEBR|nr:Protein CBR-DAF-25 [Caenorhabditis briggsae]CAP38733.2 Protein CBR-DAF-25 [Caenorhabditis briggsae]
MYIELYTENSNTRLIGALNSLITGKLADLDPVVKRLFLEMQQIRPIEYYEYYIELLGELQMCSVIDKTDEKQLPRVIQLIGLLSELKLQDVPKACGKLYYLMGTMKGDGKKKSSVMDNAVKSKLLPKIFDSIILSAGGSKILNLSRNSVHKMVELVINEKYSYAEQATISFAPLQFLNRIFQEFEIWEKSWAALKNRLDSFKMSNPQAPIVFLYFLSLIYRNDQSLIGCLVEFLELQYHQNSENSEIKNFSNAEINQFLAKKSFCNSEFSILIDKLKDDLNFSITSDTFWRILLEKIDENSMIFIENQLKMLINRQDRKSIQTKIEQIFRKILKNFEEKSTKKLELVLLKFPKILFDFNDEQWRLMPPTTTISLKKERILQISAILFEKLAAELQRSGDTNGKAPFCQISTIIDDYLKKILYVIDRVFERQLRCKESNEIMSLKLWLILFFMRETSKFVESHPDKTPEDASLQYAKIISTWQEGDEIRRALDVLLRNAVAAFPYKHSLLHETLLKALGRTPVGQRPSAYEYIVQSLFGQRIAAVCQFCTVCGHPGAKKRCPQCKLAYCSQECQKFDWTIHKKVCSSLKGNQEISADDGHMMPLDQIQDQISKIDI